MLDVKLLRDHFDDVKEKLKSRNEDLSGLEKFPMVDQQRRQLITEVERLKNHRNVVSKQIADKKKTKESAEDLILEMRRVGVQIKALDEQIRQLDEEIKQILLRTPNLPHESVPIGESEEDNEEVHRVGTPREDSDTLKPHWEIGADLDILDFERAAKVTGSRFVFYKGLGARLERALINFMIDLHVEENGYTEIIPPSIINEKSLIGTGQLPKFAEDLFRLENTNRYYLLPTAEVPITNYYANEILSAEDLPKYFVGFSTNFRSEAGSAGRDTRGLIRHHQFNKVELVKFVKPEDSYDELEKLREDAEKILQRLELPYRVVTLCTGDTGFSAAKTYDLEVWMPSNNTYREISSCSNTEDFQARRANIRFRRGPKEKPEYVHTLNGSGLAVGRTVAAILENYQQEDGSVLIPKALQPYMRVERIPAK